MKNEPLLLAKIAVAGMMAVSASATGITYNTNSASTMFQGDGLTLFSSFGPSATLTFDPVGDTTIGVPSGISFGAFTLTCSGCGTQDSGLGSFFDNFVFDLVLTDVTDGGVGTYVGTSAGGEVFSDVSQILISWVPKTFGPGPTNGDNGDFGAMTWTLSNSIAQTVAPNSGGANAGQTTIQASVTAVPEPAVFTLTGAGLLCLGLVSRRRFRV